MVHNSAMNIGRVTAGLLGSTIGLEITGNSKMLGEHEHEVAPVIVAARFNEIGTARGLVEQQEAFCGVVCKLTAMGAPATPSGRTEGFDAAIRA